jgi:hypothetical protein
MKQLPADNKRYRNAFVRLLFMILLYLCYVIARTLWLLLAIVQYLAHLFTGRPTAVGVRWGQGLAGWVQRTMLFMTYGTEVMPFPFTALGPDED